MKTLFKYLALLISTSTSQPSALAAGILLDSFTEGGFSLTSSGRSDNVSILQSDFVDTRTVFLSDIGISSSALSTTDGTLTINHTQRGLNTKDLVYTSFFYHNSDNAAYSLLGLNAVAFQITKLVGEGDVLVYTNSSPVNSTLLPITGTGTLEYPFSLGNGYIGGSSNFTLGFQFFPRSSNFSVTLSDISLIPESSTACLLIFCAAALMNRRSRRPGFRGQ